MMSYKDLNQFYQSLNKHFSMVKEWIHNVMIIIKKEDSFKKENLLTFHLKCKIIKSSHKNLFKMKRVKKEGK